ncbi:MAG TPA: hypothetical protein VKX28_27085 [Xanthobacteraceae bacterium]|nr:hypothetical protein [Xanthobacteraceae bacterium]
MTEPDKITAPFTHAQVDALNHWQRRGFVHPFTCANDHGQFSRDLVATVDGWICPHCDYRQKWAFAAMLHAPHDPSIELRRDAVNARIAHILGPAIDVRAPYARQMIGALVAVAMGEDGAP